MIHPPVGVIILNWNGWRATLQTIHSLHQSKHIDRLRLYVVDNGSSDDSLAHLEREEGVTLLPLPHNRGFAAGSNVGMRRALDDGCEFILLLNNDVFVHPDFLTPLLAMLAEQCSIGMVSPKIHYVHPPDTIWFAGGKFRQPRLIGEMVGMGERDMGQYDSPRIVDFITGCCMLVRREVCEQIGLLDEDFFFYQEDVDYCYRAAQAGFEVWYQPASLIWHAVSLSTATNLPRRTFLYAQSRIVFFGKHIRGATWIPVVVLEGIRLVRFLVTSMVQGQTEQAISYVRGLVAGLCCVRSADRGKKLQKYG